MKPLAICSACEWSALSALDAGGTPAESVTVVDPTMTQFAILMCVAEEMRYDPITGGTRSPQPCSAVNPISACPWYEALNGVRKTGLLMAEKGKKAAWIFVTPAEVP